MFWFNSFFNLFRFEEVNVLFCPRDMCICIVDIRG